MNKLQIVTVDELFSAHPIDLPGMIDPPDVIGMPPQAYGKPRKRIEGQTEMLFVTEGEAKATKVPRKGNRPIRIVDIEVTRPDHGRKAK